MSCFPLVHHQLPTTSFSSFYLTLLPTAFCQLCQSLVSTGDKTVFPHVTKATPKHFDHFQSTFIQHLLHVTTDTVSFKSSSALTALSSATQSEVFCFDINLDKVQISSCPICAFPYSRASFPSVIAGSNLPYKYSISLKKLLPQKNPKQTLKKQKSPQNNRHKMHKITNVSPNPVWHKAQLKHR